jgi:hypothetical protein
VKRIRPSRGSPGPAYYLIDKDQNRGTGLLVIGSAAIEQAL